MLHSGKPRYSQRIFVYRIVACYFVDGTHKKDGFLSKKAFGQILQLILEKPVKQYCHSFVKKVFLTSVGYSYQNCTNQQK